MRIGLVARSDDRGLGHLALEWFRRLPPERVLAVSIGTLAHGFADHLDRYPGATAVTFTDGLFPEATVRDWLAGLDLAVSFETFYDARFAGWCRDAGARSLLVAMPEFYRPEMEPDVVWAPTRWRLDLLPRDARLVPVPVTPPVGADRGYRARDKSTNTLRVVHTAGHRAAQDRNGTSLLAQALRLVKGRLDVRVECQDRRLPPVRGAPGVKVTTRLNGRADRWDLYGDADLLVLPRRYGGLCLARGTPITMGVGHLAAIETVQVGDHVRDADGPTLVTGVEHRTVPEHVTVDVRGLRLSSSLDHIHMVATLPDSPLQEVKAEQVAPGDWMLVVRPEPGGVTEVDMGAKPVRKGLRYWPERVTLDEGWARIIGLWLAEGHRNMYRRPGRDRPQSVVCWSFGEQRFADETVALLAERGIHATWHYLTSEGTYGPGGVWVVRCRTLWLYELFDRLGLEKGSFGKRAPDLDASLVPALIGGWLDGDGNEDHGMVCGWSRSTAMIRDFWRLVAKVGILASITHGGERLDVCAREDAAVVAGWTHRLKIRKEFVRPPHHRAGNWRHHPRGWMVKVRAVEHAAEPLDVVSIETASHLYVAGDILTHNCLPALEAMASGLGVVMTDCEPNLDWPVLGVRTLAGFPGEIMTPGGAIEVHRPDPVHLAAILSDLSSSPEKVGMLRDAARVWAAANTWEALLPLYRAELERACEGAKFP